MGRKTFDSMGSKPLPERTNIIITHDKNYKAEGTLVAHSAEEALKMAGNVPEVMIIGGGFLYSQMIEQADKLYLTFIELEVEGDTCFPEFEHLPMMEVARNHHLADEKNPYNCTFVDYVIQK